MVGKADERHPCDVTGPAKATRGEHHRHAGGGGAGGTGDARPPSSRGHESPARFLSSQILLNSLTARDHFFFTATLRGG